MDWTSVSFGLLALALLAIVLGSISKGLTGVGLPILAVPMMASFTSVENAVVLMGPTQPVGQRTARPGAS